MKSKLAHKQKLIEHVGGFQTYMHLKKLGKLKEIKVQLTIHDFDG